jgi:hypothetical protein
MTRFQSDRLRIGRAGRDEPGRRDHDNVAVRRGSWTQPTGPEDQRTIYIGGKVPKASSNDPFAARSGTSRGRSTTIADGIEPRLAAADPDGRTPLHSRTSWADPRIAIGTHHPDRAEISSAIREWIVPLLVRQLLQERSPAKTSTSAVNRKLDTTPLGKEQRAI